MPKRNVPLSTNLAYWVKKPDGKGYTVWSQSQLNRLIENGEITAQHQVVLKQTTY
jgi:hypothetical protein